MKKCKKCDLDLPLSDYGFNPSGTHKGTCKKCFLHRAMIVSREYRKRMAAGNDELRTYTLCRHPDEAVMRREVTRKRWHYRKITRILMEAGLNPDEDTAEDCLGALKGKV